MRKATKSAMRKQTTKGAKQGRVRSKLTDEAAEMPVAVVPTEASVAEPEIAMTTVADTEAPTVEGARASGSYTAPEAASTVEPPAEAAVATESKEVPAVDLEALRKPADAAKVALDAAEAEMKQIVEHARIVVAVARDDYRKALAPYREACRKAGRPCGFDGGRARYVSERVSFLVEKVEDGVRIEIKGRPETAQTVPVEALKQSVGKAAYEYCDRWLGPRETIGNKGGGLGNRIRAVLK